MQVKIKRLNDEATIPSYARPGDAGVDLVATSKEVFADRIVYGTGLALEIPEGHVGLIFPRSSVFKYDLQLANAVGVIDSQYRGEMRVIFKLTSFGLTLANSPRLDFDPQTYNVGDRVAQLVILPYPKVEFLETEALADTERGMGGFGSSGK